MVVRATAPSAVESVGGKIKLQNLHIEYLERPLSKGVPISLLFVRATNVSSRMYDTNNNTNTLHYNYSSAETWPSSLLH
eukprot:scaffold1045_cov186-Alexandrium_tamarense.AAC.1